MDSGKLKNAFEKEVEKITGQIREKYKPDKIILFGSSAKGNITENSDIDMLIVILLYGTVIIRKGILGSVLHLRTPHIINGYLPAKHIGLNKLQYLFKLCSKSTCVI